MDEALRRAERDQTGERARALRARLGQPDPFTAGQVPLPVGGAVHLALSEGGCCLATLQEDGCLQVWDVADWSVRYERKHVTADSLVARLNPPWVAWSNADGVHVWHPEHGDEPRVLAAPAGAHGSALSPDGLWAGFACTNRVELRGLAPHGDWTDEHRVLTLEQPHDTHELDTPHEAQLVRMALVNSPEGLRFAALGAETRGEYCCSSSHHTHYRLRYGYLLLAGTADAPWCVREDSTFLEEDELDTLLERIGPARPLAAATGSVFLPGTRSAFDDSTGSYGFDDAGLAESPACEVLAVHPAGGLLLCNRYDELVLVEPATAANADSGSQLAETCVDPFSARTATFSADGRHLAWSTADETWVAPLDTFPLKRVEQLEATGE